MYLHHPLWGSGIPQVFKILLVLGDLTYASKLGFMRYIKRQDFCSFNLAQHVIEGDCDDTIAATHGINSVTLHVTAFVTSSSLRKRTKNIATKEVPFFIFQSFEEINLRYGKYYIQRGRNEGGVL